MDRDSSSSSEDLSVKIDYYAYEKSLKHRLRKFFFKNKTTSLSVFWVLFCLKLLTCVLYVVRVCNDGNFHNANCYNCMEPYEDVKDEESIFYKIQWWALIWVKRPIWLWIIQVIIAMFTLSVTILVTYLRYKGNKWELINIGLFLEFTTTVPFIITLFYKPLINLFVPVFLNIWLANKYLHTIFTFTSNQSILAQQVASVVATLICLIFSAMCSFEHAERSCLNSEINIFTAFYFTIVTLSTVGYGDVTPGDWISRAIVVILIITALGILPKQVDSLITTWVERKKLGGSYTKSTFGGVEKHVVLYLPNLKPETLVDFLSEFFAYRRLQKYTVVILTPDDLQPVTRQVLRRQLWTNKVRYIKGICTRDIDLMRARILEADGCFILSTDSKHSKKVADELAIINSWAVKDFAPEVPQFVQIFRVENKVYLDFATLVCEEEFKYAMLAYNCICPGTSTLLTLLFHTSRGEEGSESDEEWVRLYGHSAGNEIYEIEIKDSVIFKEYIGKTFSYASYNAHRKYGVTLIAVNTYHNNLKDNILNPGPSHIMQETDICYYISITREQNMDFKVKKNTEEDDDEISTAEKDGDISVRETESEVKDDVKLHQLSKTASESSSDSSEDDENFWIRQIERIRLVTAIPPVTPYPGTNPNACHLRKEKKNNCCLRIDVACEHGGFFNAKQYSWAHKPIILISLDANNGIYNFILPLRSRVLPLGSIRPIILMVEKEPTDAFIDALSWFPLIYWLKGSIQNLDDLLRAGINIAEYVVVSNRDSLTEGDDVDDCDTIITMQNLRKYFPQMQFTTELTSTGMMRFLHFQSRNPVARYLSEFEKIENKKGSHLAFIFRLQFASGNVFSASMIHTLLYQAKLKDFIVPLTRLLLGIDDAPESGFLTGLYVTKTDLLEFDTYGKLFSHLCKTEGSIPIGIYRVQPSKLNKEFESENIDANKAAKMAKMLRIESKEITNIIRSRMSSLGFSREDWVSPENGQIPHESDDVSKDRENKMYFVILNPEHSLPLVNGDFVYYLKPSPFASERYSTTAFPKLDPSKLIYRSRLSCHRLSDSSLVADV